MIPLIRLDNNLWGYIPPALSLKEIRIATPAWEKPKLSFMLAQAVAKVLAEQNICTRPQLEKGLSLSIKEGKLSGNWNIKLERHEGLWNRFCQWIPAMRTIRDRQIAVLTCAKVEKKSPLSFIVNVPKPLKQELTLPNTFQERLHTPLFSDPYTQLAAQCLQTVDPHFISERQIYESYRFIQTAQGTLSLKKIPSREATEQEKQENRQAVSAYKKFILEEFGQEALQHIVGSYGFSFDEMVAKGAPLVPDHIFKTNIGANFIELGHLQRYFETLKKANPSVFPLKDVRKLCQKVTGEMRLPTKEELTAFLKPFEGIQNVKKLPPELFNQLVDLIMPSSEERERAYTGRKNRLNAIRGSVTLGNGDIYNPCGDLFDTLQLFDEFQKTEDWENYSQLLSHVVAKKSLFRQTADGWRIGLLIPAPKAAEGHRRWYYNEAFLDDNEGNVHMLFLPACHAYLSPEKKELPLIKAYRSTSRHSNNVNWMESLNADLNPYGSPGTLDPHPSFRYERKYFDERTIPIWVGYLLQAEKTGDAALYKQALQEYVTCLKAPGKTPHKVLEKALTLTDPTVIGPFLRAEGEFHRELPQYKKQQDIFIVGHSLGAALSQFGTYYYGTRRNRIPVPGCRYYTYSSRGPGFDKQHDQQFMQFGRKHRDLIAALGPRWKVRHDLAYGDFVPQSGESHLGTTGHEAARDEQWLDVECTVFRPLPSASNLAITTFGAHEQRTGLAKEGCDFRVQNIGVKTLAKFDHSWWMRGKLLQIFGFRFLRSSKGAELMRRVVSMALFIFVRLAIKLHNRIKPPLGQRDKRGVWALRYRSFS